MPVIMFNVEPPVETGVLLPLHDLRLPTVNFKYAPIEHVCNNTTEVVRAILEQTPIRGKHKRVLVDVKVQHLTPERCSCIPGWHCDGPLDPTHKSSPEVHHLFILGDAPTEFIAEPLLLRWDSGYALSDLQRQIPDDVAIRAIRPNTFNTYGRFDFHRGVHAKKELTRLLIRVTETDVIHPNKGAFTPVGG